MSSWTIGRRSKRARPRQRETQIAVRLATPCFTRTLSLPRAASTVRPKANDAMTLPVGVESEVSFQKSPLPAWTCDRTSLAVLEANEAARAKHLWKVGATTMRDLAVEPDRVAND